MLFILWHPTFDSRSILKVITRDYRTFLGYILCMGVTSVLRSKPTVWDPPFSYRFHTSVIHFMALKTASEISPFT